MHSQAWAWRLSVIKSQSVSHKLCCGLKKKKEVKNKTKKPNLKLWERKENVYGVQGSVLYRDHHLKAQAASSLGASWLSSACWSHQRRFSICSCVEFWGKFPLSLLRGWVGMLLLPNAKPFPCPGHFSRSYGTQDARNMRSKKVESWTWTELQGECLEICAGYSRGSKNTEWNRWELVTNTFGWGDPVTD